MGNDFHLGDAVGRVIIDASGVADGMNQARTIFADGLDEIGKSVQGLGQQMSSIGQNLSFLTAPMAAFGAVGLKVASDFDSAMKEISARTGIAGEQLKELGDFAAEMGKKTIYSGQQVSDAMLQIITSGSSAAEAMQMLPAVLDAAAASGAGLGRTADYLTDILAMAGLQATDTTMVVNSLARAAGSSSATIGDLGEAWRNVGGVARQFGLDVDTTNAILSIFSENGLKSAEAGTALKSMLLNMSAPTEKVQNAWLELGVTMYDSTGNFRDMNDVMNDLMAAMDGLSEGDKASYLRDLGGSFGIVGLSALTAGVSIEDMQQRMREQASASDVAAAKMDTFEISVQSLMGSIEALMTTALTPLMDDNLKPMVQDFTEVVNSITEWASANEGLVAILVPLLAIVTALGPVLIVLGQVVMSVGALMKAWAIIGPAVTAGLSGLLLPIAAVIGAVVLLNAAWSNNWFQIRDVTTRVVEDIRARIQPVVDLFNALSATFGAGFKEMPVNVVDTRPLKDSIDQAEAQRERLEQLRTNLLNELNQRRPEGEALSDKDRTQLENNLRSIERNIGTVDQNIARYQEQLAAAKRSMKGFTTEYAQSIQNLAANPLFERIFGEMDEAQIARLSQTILTIRDTINSFQAAPLETVRDALAGIVALDLSGIKAEIEGAVRELFTSGETKSSLAEEFASGMAVQQTSTTIISDMFAGFAQNVRQGLVTAINSIFQTAETRQQVADAMALGTLFDSQNLSVDTTAIATWATTNSNLILGTVISVVGIVLGGPVGVAIGAAGLITKAIETDFLGFGTFIEQSGIGAAVQSGVDALRGVIEGAFESLFGGGGAGPGTALAEEFASGMAVQAGPDTGGPILAVITDIVNGIKSAVDVFGPEIRESFEQIGSGISGFIDGLAGADTSGLEIIAAGMLQFFADIGAVVSGLMLIGLDIITDIFENVFPKIGEGIAAFISLLSAIMNGDPGAMIQAIADGLSAFIGAIVGAVAGFADPLIQAINTLTGSNIPALSGVLGDVSDAVTGILDAVVEAVQPAIDEFQRLVDWFLDGEIGMDKIVTFIHETFILAIATLQSTLTGIWAAVSPSLENFKNGIQRIFNWIKDYVIKPVKDMIDDLKAAIDSLPGNVGAGASGAAGIVGGLISGDWSLEDVANAAGMDTGGYGQARTPYLIGKGAQPELFVPSSSGTFYPNADEMMGKGVTVEAINIYPQINPAAGPVDEQARDFGRLILAELDSI